MTPQEQWSRSLELLRAGDWDGWPAHEWIRTARWDTKDTFEVTPTFGKPIWQGEPGTVLVNADFGMGDTIHFARFLPLVAERANVILRCDADFAGLFDFPVVSKEDPIPECDFIIHMMALPRVLGLREFSGRPYLSPKPPEAAPLLKEMGFTKIGVCWAGNPANPRDRARSISEAALPLILIPQHPMFHLVKHLPAPEHFVDLRKYMTDWNATAHVLSHLDLVISVDTAIAHLAGAIGKPTWLLLPVNCDWRWGTEDQTIWYDSMVIFRSKVENQWADVLVDVNLSAQDF